MLTLLPCCVAASAPAHSSGPHRSHRLLPALCSASANSRGWYSTLTITPCAGTLKGSERLLEELPKELLKSWAGFSAWRAWLRSLPLAKGPEPGRCTGSGWWGGTGCCRQAVTGSVLLLSVPGTAAVTHAGTAPLPLMLSIPLSPSCSLALLQSKSFGGASGKVIFYAEAVTELHGMPYSFLRWGTFCSLGVFDNLLFGCLLGFFGFGPFFIVWFGLGYGLQSTRRCLSAAV